MTELYDLSDLEMLARDCLTRAGVGEAEAAIVARDVALSEAAGDKDNGFAALLRDIRLVRYGRVHMDAVPKISKPAGAVLHVDAGHGLAAPALSHAMPRLIEVARAEGLALLHLTHASDPGAMAGAMADLAKAGLAGISLRPQGQAYAVRPGGEPVTKFDSGTNTVLSALLSKAPPPADSPVDGSVAHSGWIAALNPEVTAAEQMLDGLPAAEKTLPQRRGGIALAPELLMQIVNA